jgi:defect-in-organelle-trafficking protein DotB
MTTPILRFPEPLTQDSFAAFLIQCAEIPGVADVLIQTDDFVFAKINNVQRPITDRRIEGTEVELAVSFSYGMTGIAKLNSGDDLNFAFGAQKTVRESARFRMNVTRGRVGETADGLSMTMRFITDEPRKLETLGLEEEIVENFFPQYGLVLVAGTTGSGKTTMLSAVHRYRLEHRDPCKIIMYEDPIENVFGRLGEGRMPKVFQAEIGTGRHLNSFHQAGPNAMRRGADVLGVGEMRDRESFEVGFELAMTGHAVYATMHVETPAQAIDRAISMFPFDVQPSIASKLRGTIRMIVAQKQFATNDGSSARVRSWVVFDREVYDRLGDIEYTKWERELNKICRERGSDFDTQAFPFLRDGRITLDRFCAITNMTPREARAFATERGLDVSTLG